MAFNADVLIVGGGIAGLSLASELAVRCSIILVEAEQALGYHTSSRSARQLIPSYGPAPVRALTVRTLEIIRAFEQQLTQPILTPRGFMLIGSETDVETKASGSMQRISHAEALELCPQLKPASFDAAGLDTTSVGTDTDALLDYHRRTAEAAGARIFTGSRVHSVQQLATGWNVGAGAHAIHAGVVVNAAGAWADELAVVSGVRTQGLRPYRRTAAVVQVENQPDPQAPMVAAADDAFYFRREGLGVLVSPAESEPSVPEDAKPRPEDVEALIAKLNTVTNLSITGVQRSWTGLRTQAAHGIPVVGFDPEAPGFFWLAGQGGYGFQTSSAIAELVADLITKDDAGDLHLNAALRPSP